MCTVSILATSESGKPFECGVDRRRRRIRLACNRDELHSRPSALLPQIRLFESHLAIMPVDPISDGTWIAVNDAGVVATLLNRNHYGADSLIDRSACTLLSRGRIVPRLMHCERASEAAADLTLIYPGDFPPFRLVIADEWQTYEAVSDGLTLRIELVNVPELPRLYTSSGLGDAMVQAPRRALFERFLSNPRQDGSLGATAYAQDAFHRHCWPDRLDISVCMQRSDARTVSHTLVEIEPGCVVMTYYPDAPDRDATPVQLSIRRRSFP